MLQHNVFGGLLLFMFGFIDFLLFMHGLVLFPSLFFILIYFGYLIIVSTFMLSSKNQKVSRKLFVLLITVVILSSLAYAGVPYDVADIYPDVNYVEQLVRLYMSNGKITLNVGTGEAKSYSFYPFIETFMVIASSITHIRPTYILRMWFIISSSLTFLIAYLFYKRIIEEHVALTASFITTTMFRSNFQLSTNPTHPMIAFLFMIMLMTFFFRHCNDRKSKFIILFILLALSISHNTTVFILMQLFIFYFIFILLFCNKNNEIFDFNRNLYGSLRLLCVLYLSYNIFVASSFFFEHGVVPTIYNFLFNIMFKEFSPITFFSTKYELYISSNTTPFGLFIVKPLYYVGYLSTGLFICLLFILLSLFLKKRDTGLDIKMNVMFFLSMAALGMLLVNSYLWFSNLTIGDYYYRFFAFLYLFSSVIVARQIERMYCKADIKMKLVALSLLIVILAQSLILTHPLSLFGADTPFSLEDVRIGPKQAIATAYYLEKYYDGEDIYGTRYVFNIIGPRAFLNVIQLKEEVHNDKINVISNIEGKILDLTFAVNDINILYTTGEFSIMY